jgi:hypothetical protein
MNIRQKLNAVMKAVNYVQKDTSVKAGNSSYKAVTHDQVTALTRGELTAIGVSIETSVVERKTTFFERGKDDKGNVRQPGVFYEGVFDVAFVNIDDATGTDKVVKRVDAHGKDYDDKAPNKAESMAQKRAILKLLQLESGEDDESRIQHEGDEAEKVTNVQPYLDRVAQATTGDEVGKIGADYLADAKANGWRTKDTDVAVQEACSKRRGVLAEAKPAKLDLPAEKEAAAEKLQAEFDRRDKAAAKKKASGELAGQA